MHLTAAEFSHAGSRMCTCMHTRTHTHTHGSVDHSNRDVHMALCPSVMLHEVLFATAVNCRAGASKIDAAVCGHRPAVIISEVGATTPVSLLPHQERSMAQSLSFLLIKVAVVCSSSSRSRYACMRHMCTGIRGWFHAGMPEAPFFVFCFLPAFAPAKRLDV